MVRHTVHVWSESEDRSGAETGLAAITDTLLAGNVSGDTLKLAIHDKIALVYMNQMSGGKSAFHPVRGRITSPTRAGNPLTLTKGYTVGDFSPNQVYDFREGPIDWFKKMETLTGYGYEEDEAATAHILSIVIVVSDGPIPTVGRPRLDYVHACTVATATGAASTWKESTLTESYALPAGDYRCWGARVVSATAIAARIYFPQHQLRLATIPVAVEDFPNHPFAEYWGLGVPFTMPGGLPSLEYCAAANETGDHVELYLTKG